MGKAPSEEEQYCSPQLTLVTLNPDQHPTECSRLPVGATGSFEAAESISLLHLAFLWAAKKTPSDLQGSDLRHSPILLAIALGSDCVAERLLQEQHPPTPKVKKYLPSNSGSIELWPVRHCITKLSCFYSTGEFEALRSKVRAQK